MIIICVGRWKDGEDKCSLCVCVCVCVCVLNEMMGISDMYVCVEGRDRCLCGWLDGYAEVTALYVGQVEE